MNPPGFIGTVVWGCFDFLFPFPGSRIISSYRLLPTVITLRVHRTSIAPAHSGPDLPSPPHSISANRSKEATQKPTTDHADSPLDHCLLAD